jgi:CRISPR-associated helicase Cas3/CRISPR-associated endonuclease Cas3-HD
MSYYAHSAETPEKSWQTIVEHLENTAGYAARYASSFNAEEFGYICGLLHDLGKYSQKFQMKLQGMTLSVDHSTAGAKEAINLYGKSFGRLLAYCIAGHHSGLPDYGTEASLEGTLYARLSKEIEDYSAYKNEYDFNAMKKQLKLPVKPIDSYQGFTLAFFIRMIYSCLVDADFIDTETYMSGETKPRGNNTSIAELNCKFNEFVSHFESPKTKINIKRKEILQSCLNAAKLETGLYSLTVPTGGGKTYSSLAFALNHASINNLNRIIYVIPYTSIIEQNAKVFKDALGESTVLEHHSNFQFDNNRAEDIQTINEKLKLASENWDIPIIVTTNVQFFESLFSNRSSKCRKVHNIAKSVIIFDEAQMLPVEYLKPCLVSVAELVKNYGSTAVLCTATQPSINELLPKNIKPVEIIENPKQLYVDFKKVKVYKVGETDDDMLAGLLNEHGQVLCIVNTRKHAKEIFNRLDEGNKYHLSTLMCPVHRQNTLKEIRNLLKNGQPCKVVSTQLIEAGVDVDFPFVYRAIAGIDSIVQSAGRCNREGKLEEGKVFVFKPVSEYAKVRGYLDRTAKIADMVFRKFEDPISLDAIDYYFKMLYDLEGSSTLDKKGILSCFEEGYRSLEFDFKTAAEKFKLIENNTYSIIIPYDENAENLINEARFSQYPRSAARKLQPYTISVYEYEYKALLKNNALKTINDSFTVLDNFEMNYNSRTGLNIPQDTYGEAIFA